MLRYPFLQCAVERLSVDVRIARDDERLEPRWLLADTEADGRIADSRVREKHAAHLGGRHIHPAHLHDAVETADRTKVACVTPLERIRYRNRGAVSGCSSAQVISRPRSRGRSH